MVANIHVFVFSKPPITQAWFYTKNAARLIVTPHNAVHVDLDGFYWIGTHYLILAKYICLINNAYTFCRRVRKLDRRNTLSSALVKSVVWKLG